MAAQNLFTPPEKIGPQHNLELFDCGEPLLNDWLRRRALRNENSGASRTYVVCSDTRVIGYYSLAVGALACNEAPGRVRRNMPDPIPIMLIGRLAVDRSCQGRGLGRGLLRDAVLRVVQASEIAGIRAILVHALTDEAKGFYERCGFRSSPVDPMTLMMTVAGAIAGLD